MEDSSEDESIYITHASTKDKKLNEDKGVVDIELAVLFENEKVQERENEHDEYKSSVEGVNNSEIFEG